MTLANFLPDAVEVQERSDYGTEEQ